MVDCTAVAEAFTDRVAAGCIQDGDRGGSEELT